MQVVRVLAAPKKVQFLHKMSHEAIVLPEPNLYKRDKKNCTLALDLTCNMLIFPSGWLSHILLMHIFSDFFLSGVTAKVVERQARSLKNMHYHSDAADYKKSFICST